MTVEWPRWLVSDRLAVGVAVVCAGVVEAVLANHPDLPGGLGLALGFLLVGGQLWRLSNERAIFGVRLDAAGRWTLLTRQGGEPADVAPGTRVLGRTIVLRLRTGGGTRKVWLTALDVPASVLRELRVRLLAEGARLQAQR